MCLSILSLLGCKFNKSNSIPFGLYKLSSASDSIRRNQFVLFCPPNTKAFQIAHERGYIPEGYCQNGYMPLMKKVVGIPLDSYEFTTQGLILNGKLQINTVPLEKDSWNQKLPVFREKGILKKDEYILMGTESRNSFDARYYGLIKKENIKGTLKPIWVRSVKND